jgi:DNA-directed RNA polymerase specialized sigma subunit
MNSVIVRINDLIDQHGDNFTKCQNPNCSTCNEIKKLSKQLWPGERWKKPNTIPFKDRMTKERYLELKQRGYTDSSIAKEYGVSHSAVFQWKKKNLKKDVFGA